MANCVVCGKKLGGITGKSKPTYDDRERAERYNIELPEDICAECAYDKIGHELGKQRQAKDAEAEEKKARLQTVLATIAATPAALPPDYTDLGLVTGYCIMGTGPISAIASSWTDFFGAESNAYLEKISKAEEFALRRLKQKAYDKGATAIYDLHVSLSEASSGHGMLMMSVWGSAAKKKDG